MKRILTLAVAAALLCAISCNKQQTQKVDPIEVSLEVVDIADNCATVKAELTSGKFYGAKIIEAVNKDDVTIDVTSDIQLVNYVEKEGVEVTLPYTNTLTGLKIGKEKFTAIIVYDNTGRACRTATVVWTPEGLPDGWSTENNPGKLDEIQW